MSLLYGATGGSLFAEGRNSGHGYELLDNRLAQLLKRVKPDQFVADLGCGSGYCTVRLAELGARVYAQDRQPAMVEQTRVALSGAKAGVADHVTLEVGDASHLPAHLEHRFDQVWSINAGCDMSTQMLGRHIMEAERVCKPDGEIIFVYPDCLQVLFTDGRITPKNLRPQIQETLLSVDASDQARIQTILTGFDNVLFGTFVQRESNLRLVMWDAEKVAPGERIWRKLPGLAVPSYFHTSKEYGTIINKSGLEVAEEYHDRFLSEAELQAYNASHPKATLGLSFWMANAFTVMVLRKKPQ